MIRYLLAVALLVAASCVPVYAGDPVMKADPAYGVRYTQEKVVALPQDQETPYLTLFGDRNDPKLNEMVRWFETDQTLAGIKSQTHWNVIYTDTVMYQDRYARTISALPCVRLQAADEERPVAEYAGVNVPMTADALAKGLNTSAGSAECFRHWHKNHSPQPSPKPLNPVRPDPSPQPLLPPTPKSQDMTWVLIVALALAGGGVGAAKHFSDIYHGRKV
jgi:hypothetical protein